MPIHGTQSIFSGHAQHNSLYSTDFSFFPTLSKFNIFYLLHLITLNNRSVIYTTVHNALLPKLIEGTGAVYYIKQKSLDF